ncbi:MAG: TIM barrel protein [Acidobacteriaceae bacterium]
MQLAVTMVKEAPEQVPLVLRGDYAGSIELAARIGYDAVELHVADPAEVDAGQILDACQTSGLTVSSIGTGLASVRDGLTLTCQEEGVRQRAIDRLQEFIRLGSELGAVVIVGLIKGMARDCRGRTEYKRHLTAALKECLAVAQESGVTLVLEAMNRYESDVLNTIDECVRYIEGFTSERLKLHIDTYHMNIEEDRIGRNIVAAANHIGHVHIADSNRAYPGLGHYNFAETIAALNAAGYDGALAVECLARPTAEQAARESFEFLRGALMAKLSGQPG